MSRSYYTPVHSSEADVEAAAELIQWQTHSAKTVKHIIEDFLDITGDVWAVIVLTLVYFTGRAMKSDTQETQNTKAVELTPRGQKIRA